MGGTYCVLCGKDVGFVRIHAAASRSLSAVADAQLLASRTRGWRSRIVFSASEAVVLSAPLMQSTALPWIL